MGRRWVPAVVAGCVAVLGAGVLVVLPEPGGVVAGAAPAPAPVAVTGVAESVAGGKGRGNEGLLVRDGVRVRVSGQVIAAPGVAPVFCPARPVPAIAPAKEAAPGCPAGLRVELKGVDVAKLTDLRAVDGVKFGQAGLVGVWRAGAIDVREQTAPVPGPEVRFPALPCPAPKGGWTPKPSNLDSPAVAAFLDKHRDQVFGPVVHYPYGQARSKPVVVMLGVAHGDRDAVRRQFEQVFSGNLCVAPAKLSEADGVRLGQQVGDLMSRPELGIYGTGTAPDGSAANVQLLVYTKAVKEALTPIGLDVLRVEPAVRPVV
ncbi:hypothetical protein HPO96_23915 [Kribbella sandramycini]|uniref:Uncharacterized protein n=1 Tax=Kribbella sandramycini TaxID=60450 RepID=A0A7Y4P140_9ACTN|nr:hypothetical protein [Kribbella sandramycini]MBB6571300.1 hypothetical protein [Kribbella sandramycini]NOL43296.1 hypothetical protein [Kribbella sandramycini]